MNPRTAYPGTLVAGVALAFGVFVSPASEAAVITNSLPFSHDIFVGGVLFEQTVGQFDPALGTLRSAVLSLDSTVTYANLAIMATRRDPTLPFGSTVSQQSPVQAWLGVAPRTEFVVDILMDGPSISCSGGAAPAPDTCQNAGAASVVVPLAGSQVLDDVHLAGVIGTGGVRLLSSFPLSAVDFDSENIVFASGNPGDRSWAGVWSMVYTYDPIGVPEPGTLALIAVGLAALAAARRRLG